jgi:hypothetical protein
MDKETVMEQRIEEVMETWGCTREQAIRWVAMDDAFAAEGE